MVGVTDPTSPNVRVHAIVAVGIGEAYSPKITMKSNFWNNWARIAIAHANDARRSRDEWKSGALRNIQPEMHASMVCITAVAFAIDALHADVAPLVDRNPDPRSQGGRQWGYFLETFRRANPVARLWQNDLDWLFGLRHSAVHFQGVSREPVWHEDLGTNVAQENILFAVESAVRAVVFLMTVFGAIFGPDPARQPRVADWGSARAHVLVELESLRSA